LDYCIRKYYRYNQTEVSGHERAPREKKKNKYGKNLGAMDWLSASTKKVSPMILLHCRFCSVNEMNTLF
jgi:hypothetical protein